MEVIVSSGGVFHAYHTARAALKAGVLKQFITGIYLKNEPDIDTFPITKISLPNLIGHGIQQIPHPNSVYASYQVRDNLFDRMARRVIQPSDIFHGWNHMSLHSLRRAKAMGAKIIIERSNAHPDVQIAIMREEYERFGLDFPTGMAWLVEKHLQEYEEADGIMVCSEFVGRTLIEQGVPEHKILPVDLGFDPKRFGPGEKADDVFRVVFVGQISLRKGVPYLLDAFQRLALPNAELVLIGGKTHDSQLFLPGYEGVYRHVPFVSQAELVGLYQNSSVLVLPSLEEGFGMVVYEAAACGVPVIISENVGAAIRDEVDGMVVPIRDPQALAESLQRLYEDEELRRRMGESAREYVQQFTWDTYGRQLLSHYQNMML